MQTDNPQVKQFFETKYLTVKQFCDQYPWPTEGGLRSIIFNADTNGFKHCIKRMGRRVLIDVKGFWDTIEKKGMKK